MKFSVLIPTRNRLALLRIAVETVLAQDYANWEIVISDNASEDNVAGYVAALGDDRVRYIRSDVPLSVTENWNRCLTYSTGDYVVMLGDDDGLLRGYFSENLALIRKFKEPELVFVQGLQFVYAGVMPGHAKAYIQVANCEFLQAQTEPFVLRKASALSAVKKAARFEVAFPYNMQYVLLKRHFIARLSTTGSFFQSPYPDYYASNLAMIEAKDVVVQPIPLVAIGISSKSFGFYYFNKRESEGVAFLRNTIKEEAVADLAQTILPGSDMNTSWLLAMYQVERNRSRSHDIAVSRWRYRFLQLRYNYVNRESFRDFWALLGKHASLPEQIFWLTLHLLIKLRTIGIQAERRSQTRERILDMVHCAYPKVEIFARDVHEENVAALSRHLDPRKFMLERIDKLKLR